MTTGCCDNSIGLVRTMEISDLGIEFISQFREVLIRLDSEDLGFVSWHDVKVYDFMRAGLWSFKYNEDPILPLALIGPGGTVVLLKLDSESNLRVRAERHNSVKRVIVSKEFGTQRVSPVIIAPSQAIIQSNITCHIGGGVTEGTDAMYAKRFVSEVCELRSTTGSAD